jgi:hypothetical protein
VSTTAAHLPLARAWTTGGRVARRRGRYANGLERAVQAARSPMPAESFTSAAPVQRAEVLATRALMLKLASRLREARGASAAALEPARRLLTDGTGPLYSPGEPGALRDAVVVAILALEHGGHQPS